MFFHTLWSGCFTNMSNVLIMHFAVNQKSIL